MILSDIHSSLLRFCADFAANYPGMSVVNFDAHADESTVPNTDVIGISSLSVKASSQLITVKGMFGLSTVDDTNLFRLVSLMDDLYDKLLPTRILQIYDAVTGADNGILVVEDGTNMLPVGGSIARPLQFVMISMASTRTLKF